MAKLYQSPEDYLVQEERRHTRVSRILMLGVAGIVFVLVIFLVRVVSSEYSLNFKIVTVAIVGALVLLFSYSLLRDYSFAQWRAVRYAKGRAGELRVLRMLLTLDDRYTVFYGGKISKGNIDFMVLRGNVLFNIEVKNHAGTIMFDGHEMLRNGQPFSEHGLLGQVVSSEKQLKASMQSLPHLTKLKVISVLVFANSRAFVETVGLVKGVHVTHLRLLKGLIESYCKHA